MQLYGRLLGGVAHAFSTTGGSIADGVSESLPDWRILTLRFVCPLSWPLLYRVCWDHPNLWWLHYELGWFSFLFFHVVKPWSNMHGNYCFRIAYLPLIYTSQKFQFAPHLTVILIFWACTVIPERSSTFIYGPTQFLLWKKPWIISWYLALDCKLMLHLLGSCF